MGTFFILLLALWELQFTKGDNYWRLFNHLDDMNHSMRFLTMLYVQSSKPQISLHIHAV